MRARRAGERTGPGVGIRSVCTRALSYRPMGRRAVPTFSLPSPSSCRILAAYPFKRSTTSGYWLARLVVSPMSLSRSNKDKSSFCAVLYLECRPSLESANCMTGETSISISHGVMPSDDGHRHSDRRPHGDSSRRTYRTSSWKCHVRRFCLLAEGRPRASRTSATVDRPGDLAASACCRDLARPSHEARTRNPPSKLVPFPSRSGFAEPAWSPYDSQGPLSDVKTIHVCSSISCSCSDVIIRPTPQSISLITSPKRPRSDLPSYFSDTNKGT